MHSSTPFPLPARPLLSLSACASLTAAVLLTGCGMGMAPSLQPGTAAVGAITGNIHGGQPPITGAHVYLYQSVSTGYGSAAKSLLGAAGNTTSDGTNYYVTTDSSGGFSLSGDYTCTSGAQVYVYVTGGNAGGGTNSAIGLLAGVGQCPSTGTLANQVPYVWVNEVTTVATAYALAGFMSTPTQLSIANTNLAATGLANAMANATNIVGVANGVASATTLAAGSNGTVPQTKINTLANILAACVNSNGPGSNACNTLLTTATNTGTSTGTPAPNTAQAILNIAHFPGSNVATLYGIPAPQQAFAPALTAQPNDFLLPITFRGSTHEYVVSIAIDTTGTAWTTDSGFLGKITPLGIASIPAATPFPGSPPYLPNVAVSPSGTIWCPDGNNSQIDIYNGSSFTTASLGGLTVYALAFLSNGQAYTTDTSGNESNTLSLLSSSAVVQYTTGTSPNIKGPYFIAVDSSNAAWETSQYAAIGRFPYAAMSNTSIPAITSYSLTGSTSTSDASTGIAIDHNDTVWVTQSSESKLYKMTNSGANAGVFTGGGLNYPGIDAVDGAGNIWVADHSGNGISEFTNAGVALSPASGYSSGAADPSVAIAVDGSGNVWVGTFDLNQPVSMLLGAATPVATPILPNQNGVRP